MLWLLGFVWTTCKWLILAVLIAVLICCVLFGVKILHWLTAAMSWLWKPITGNKPADR